MKLEGHIVLARSCAAPPIYMALPTAHASADFDEMMNLLVIEHDQPGESPGGGGGSQ